MGVAARPQSEETHSRTTIPVHLDCNGDPATGGREQLEPWAPVISSIRQSYADVVRAVILQSLERTQLRPSLRLRTCACILPLLLLALTIPNVASSQPSDSPELAPEVRERLSQAAADPLLPPWQREVMVRVAHGSMVATPDPSAAGDRAVVSAELPGPTDAARADLGAPASARDAHSAIYDPVRDRMVVFGGWRSGTNFNDVWELSLAGTPAWTELTPSGTPPSVRRYHSAIYDPVRDRMVVFGGFNGDVYLNDVWELSLAGTPAWTELTPSGTPPHSRYRQSAIYDPVRDRMVMFAGWWSGTNFNDVWELSLAGTPAWTELVPSGTPPNARYSHSAIYDPVRDRMVVYGGVEYGYLNDVWELSLAGTPAWTELTPGGTPPRARYVHSAIYDPVRDRMVVFGGFTGEFFVNEVWALSLAGAPEWTALTPGGTPPSGRYGHSAIHDPVRDRMVVFAGYNASGFLDDVWDLSLAGTTAWAPALAPELHTLTVNVTHGSVTQDPPPGGGTYAHGTAVLLTATPEVGYHFADYSGDVVAVTDTVTVVMTGDKTVTANFSADSVTLTVNATNGSVTEAPLPSGGRYVYGTAVLLTETPEAGYQFVDYSGDVVAVTDTVTVVMTGDKTVSANFQSTAGVAGKARPAVTLLMPAMPNPFRQSATLAFSIARGGPVDLAVYSVDGRRVRTLVRESREPGEYRATWDGRDDGGNPISAGVYYARLETVDWPLTRIMTYLR